MGGFFLPNGRSIDVLRLKEYNEIMDSKQKDLFNHFLSNHDEYVEHHDGKAVVIYNFEVVAEFDNEIEAGQYALAQYEPGTFIVQFVSADPASYTAYIFTPGIVLTPA